MPGSARQRLGNQRLPRHRSHDPVDREAADLGGHALLEHLHRRRGLSAEDPVDIARWNAITAALVRAPNLPSTVSFAPRAFSRYCSDLIVAGGQAPVWPWLSTGHGCKAAMV